MQLFRILEIGFEKPVPTNDFGWFALHHRLLSDSTVVHNSHSGHMLNPTQRSCRAGINWKQNLLNNQLLTNKRASTYPNCLARNVTFATDFGNKVWGNISFDSNHTTLFSNCTTLGAFTTCDCGTKRKALAFSVFVGIAIFVSIPLPTDTENGSDVCLVQIANVGLLVSSSFFLVMSHLNDFFISVARFLSYDPSGNIQNVSCRSFIPTQSSNVSQLAAPGWETIPETFVINFSIFAVIALLNL